jgi:pimeloyl-ACP methyl ester carboxylesterase
MAIGLTLIALGGVGAIYQSIATATDQHDYPAPGQLVDVGGHRLHLLVMGTEREGPTVILESGLALPSIEWALVQPEIAPFARVVAYDRPGLGWIEDGHQPHDARHIAQQLHTALQQAGISAPYVFAGHSVGGLYARAFAAEYPDEVAGMIFVDATTPGQFAQIPRLERGQKVLGTMLRVAATLAWIGVPRLADLPAFFMGYEDRRVVAEFPQMGAMRALWASPRHLRAAAAEAAMLVEPSSSQVGGMGSLRDMPVFVLTAGAGRDAGPEWTRAQAEMAALSSDSLHRVIPGVSHGALTFDRQHNQVTVAAIRDVIEAVRMGQPLVN